MPSRRPPGPSEGHHHDTQPPAMDHLRVDHGHFQVPGMHPPPMANQPPPIFGTYLHDGLPVMPDLHMGFDPSALLGDDNDAKRRRIARVSAHVCARHGSAWLTGMANRLATCAARRRSSATGNCPPAPIASTTRPNASSPRSRRREVRRKGKASSPPPRDPARRPLLRAPAITH